MTPMKARMSRSSRLDSGRTAVATSAPRATAASAMDRVPGIDPDPLRRQEGRQLTLLRDRQPANEVHREIGAKERSVHGVGHDVGTEERAQEREGVHPDPHDVGLAAWGGLDQDVFRTD